MIANLREQLNSAGHAWHPPRDDIHVVVDDGMRARLIPSLDVFELRVRRRAADGPFFGVRRIRFDAAMANRPQRELAELVWDELDAAAAELLALEVPEEMP